MRSLPFSFGIGQTVRMLTIPTTPEIEQRLKEEARRSGLSVEEFALQKLLAGLPEIKPPLTPEELDEMLNKLRKSAPPPRLSADEMRELEEEDKRLDETRDRRLSAPYIKEAPALSEAEFESSMNELCAAFDDIAFGTRELRALKEEEMDLEEAKHARLFGRSGS